MDEAPLYNELCQLLRQSGLEIRVESFKTPPESAGGLCLMDGKHLVLLHSGASKAERIQALLEVVETAGLPNLGLQGTDFSPELLSRLNRRGQMPWPHRSRAPSVAKVTEQAKESIKLIKSTPHLAHFTTMALGGPAESFVDASRIEDIIAVTREARDKGTPLFLLGGGSNIVVSDEGVPGTVLRVNLKGISLQPEGETIHVTAAAGENWHDFAEEMSRKGYAGLECLGGIPGRVGATPIQNVGAYGQEVSQSITRVRTLCRETLEERTFEAAECGFGYRNSIFKQELRDTHIVLSVTFSLTPGGTANLRFGELSRALSIAEGDAAPDLATVFDTVVKLRRAKSMVYDPKDENHRSCGSFFVNAQIPQERADAISEKVGERIPTYPGENGLVKVPSAWLIERAGLTRGSRRGPVGLSTRHTLAVVAQQGARATDVVSFAHYVRNLVQQEFEVLLHPEPHFWGFGALEHGLPADSRPGGS